MSPPALRCLRSLLLILSLPPAAAATFPLPIPTRPTSFPLQRPAQAGEVVAWGDNTDGQSVVPADLTNVVAISAAANHNLALKSDGTVSGWGDNQFGQASAPAGLGDVVAISTGPIHSLALRSDGTVRAWGNNDLNQLAVPSEVNSVVAISAGNNYSLALKSDGTVLGWGQLGTPVPAGLTNVVSVTAGASLSFAIRADGTVTSWGGDAQYGLPRDLTELSTVAAASNGPLDSAGLRRDGNIIPARYDSYNLPLGLRAVAIALTQFHTAAITGEGTVVTWGSDGAAGLTNLPPRLRGVFAVACGYRHTIVVKLPTPPIPTTAIASAQIDHGFVVALNIIDGGEGYDVPPKVTITGGGGSGATATAQISKGVVTGFTMTNAGIGYTSQPTITIDPPPFLPKLSIAPSRVNVVLQVVPGKRYQLESSDDLPNFSPVGAPFTATSNTITNEFTLSETGQFFRVEEVP